MNCYSSYLMCYCTKTGKSFPLSCRSYNCEQHGRFNRGRLRGALYEYLNNWETIRFWTFTLSSKSFYNSSSHLITLNKIWRYFITELRRNRIMTFDEKNTQFIRFSEPHKSGYFHYHAVFDRYVPWHKIDTLWRSAVETVSGLNGDRGGVHVKGINNAKNTSYYIVKYVTKSGELMPSGSRKWTKSSKVSLFPKKTVKGSYAIHNTLTDEWYGLKDFIPLLETNITQLHKMCSNFELFPGFYHPPEDNTYTNH